MKFCGSRDDGNGDNGENTDGNDDAAISTKAY